MGLHTWYVPPYVGPACRLFGSIQLVFSSPALSGLPPDKLAFRHRIWTSRTIATQRAFRRERRDLSGRRQSQFVGRDFQIGEIQEISKAVSDKAGFHPPERVNVRPDTNSLCRNATASMGWQWSAPSGAGEAHSLSTAASGGMFSHSVQ